MNPTSQGKLNDSSKKLLKHRFEDESGTEYTGNEFGDFGSYMNHKRIKIQNQAQEILRQQQESKPSESESSSNKDVFKGCIIYINGYTGIKHSTEELQRMIISHGGIYVQHMTGKTSVTHIVATTLTSRKKEQFANYIVVVPEWIEQCIETGKLLDWKGFRTVHESLPRGQTKLALGQSASTTNKASTTGKSSEPAQEIRTVPKITDPEFITHFYKNSRLHHLSMWKAAVRQRYLMKASVLASNVNSQRAKRENEPHIRVILHIDFDSFFASVAKSLRPEILESAPLCVASGSHDNSDIASCNYPARKFGVRNGMFLLRAKQLCPDLIILGYDFEAYEEASLYMYEILTSVGADLIYPISVDEAQLDVTNLIWSQINETNSQLISRPVDESQASIDRQSSGLEGSEERLQKIIARLATNLGNTLRAKVRTKTGLDTSVGIGPNTMLARVALSKAKPAGTYCISWNTRFNSLLKGKDADGSITEGISLKDLPGVGYNIVTKLAEPPLNIRDFEGLANLACSDLVFDGVSYRSKEGKKAGKEKLELVFGPKLGTKLWEYGQGICEVDLRESIETALSRKSIGVEISWGVRADTREDVGQFVRNLCKELTARMAEGGLSSISGVMTLPDGENQKTKAEIPTIKFLGSNVTVKIYKTKKNADPRKSKFLGHGQCDIFSKSRAVPSYIAPTRDPDVIADLVLAVFDASDCSPMELRGLGIQMTKLVEETPRNKESTKPAGKRSGILQFIERPPAQDAVRSSVVSSAQTLKSDNNPKPTVQFATPTFKVPNLIEPASSPNSFPQITSPVAISTPKTPKTPQNQINGDPTQIDWNIYSELPSTIRRIVKEEYNLPNTPNHSIVSPVNRNNHDHSNTVKLAARTITQVFTRRGGTRTPSPPISAQVLQSRELSIHSDGTNSAPVSPQKQGWKRIHGDGGLTNGQFTLTQRAWNGPLAVGPSNPALRPLNITTTTRLRGFSGRGRRGRGSRGVAQAVARNVQFANQFLHRNQDYNYYEHPSIIDPSTLAALPMSIVQELETSVNSRRKMKQEAEQNDRLGDDNRTQHSLADINNSRKAKYRDTLYPPILDLAEDSGNGEETSRKSFELSKFSDVCTMVRLWIKETANIPVNVPETKGILALPAGREDTLPDEPMLDTPRDDIDGATDERYPTIVDVAECTSPPNASQKGVLYCDQILISAQDSQHGVHSFISEPVKHQVASSLRDSSISKRSIEAAAHFQDSFFLSPSSEAQILQMFEEMNQHNVDRDESPTKKEIIELSREYFGSQLENETGDSIFGIDDTDEEEVEKCKPVMEILEPGPHPADLELFYQYCQKLSRDPLRWVNAVKLARWVQSEVLDIVGCDCSKKELESYEAREQNSNNENISQKTSEDIFADKDETIDDTDLEEPNIIDIVPKAHRTQALYDVGSECKKNDIHDSTSVVGAYKHGHEWCAVVCHVYKLVKNEIMKVHKMDVVI